MKTMIYVGNAKQGGVSAFELDRETSALRERGQFLPEQGLSPLAVSPDRRFLYAATGGKQPGVTAFAVDAADGRLHVLNAVPTPEDFVYMTVDAGGRFLLGASYGGDTLCVMPLGREGFALPEPAFHLRCGRNPHCVVLDASNRFAYVPILGSDCVGQFRFDAATGALAANSPAAVAAAREAGPRHLVLSPDNRFAYVLMEMGGEIVSYAVCRERGTLTALHTMPLLPKEKAFPRGSYTPPLNQTGGPNSPTPVMWAAEIRLTPDGRFLFASERTGSTLSIFRVDPISGRLDFAGVVDTEKQPRGFAVDAFGQYVFVAGEASNHLSMYALDTDGRLTECGRYRVGTGPNWVEAVTVR